MSRRNNSKIAHVIERGGKKVLAFNKVTTTVIPPHMLFECENACKVFRDGVHLEGYFSFKLRGIRGEDLEINDRIQVVSIPDFYEKLYLHGQTVTGCVVWLDQALETMVKRELQVVV